MTVKGRMLEDNRRDAEEQKEMKEKRQIQPKADLIEAARLQ